MMQTHQHDGLVARKAQIFERDVRPRLRAGGIQIADWDDLKKTQHEQPRADR